MRNKIKNRIDAEIELPAPSSYDENGEELYLLEDILMQAGVSKEELLEKLEIAQSKTETKKKRIHKKKTVH